MIITEYSVQSVLRTYTRQLRRSKLADKSEKESGDQEEHAQKESIRDEGKHTMMIGRLTNLVLDMVRPDQDEGAGTAQRKNKE